MIRRPQLLAELDISDRQLSRLKAYTCGGRWTLRFRVRRRWPSA
jgi:hypothetical protein